MSEIQVGEYTFLSSSKSAAFVSVFDGSKLQTIARAEAEALFNSLRAAGLHYKSVKTPKVHVGVAAAMQQGDYWTNYYSP